MAVLIDYIWQSTFCMLIFYGIYWIFLRNEKIFHVTRLFLLIAPILALIFPLISIPVGFDKPDISLEQTQFYRALSIQEAPDEIAATFGLPEVTVESTKLPILWEFKDYFILSYFAVIIFLSFRLFWNFIQLRLIWEKGWYQTSFNLKDNYFLIPTFGLTPVFSFFNKLFWDDTQELLPKEKEQIIQHEIVHIRQRHSYDVLFYQVLSVIFWYNPAIHLLRNALVDVHEYLADENVLKETSHKEIYPKLIVKMAFKGIDLPIGNYFIRSTTLKRIMMMKKSAKTNWVKTLMVFPLSLALMALVSMKTNSGNKLIPLSLTDNIENIRNLLLASQDSLDIHMKVKKIKSPLHYEYIHPLEGDLLKAQIGELQYEFSQINTDEDYIKVRSLIQSLRNTSQIRKEYPETYREDQVDRKAEPRQGLSDWSLELIRNLEIPKKELALGIGGRLEVEFVINQVGNIEKPVIKTSFGGGLDDLILKEISKPAYQGWKTAQIDGKPVKMLQTVTFAFSPENNVTANAASTFFNPKGNEPVHQNIVYGQDEVFDVVEDAPEFEGGMEALKNYLKTNLKYTDFAKEKGIEGTVYVVFVVTKEGKVENPEILRGIGGGLDQEALRVISESPAWIPGKQSGKDVNVRMRLPIRFKLPEPHTSLNGVATLDSPSYSETGIQPSEAFNIYVRRNIKYPLAARESEISGVVRAELTLNKDGLFQSISIINSSDKSFDEEVLRVLDQNKEKWLVDGKQEKYKVVLPINFMLANKNASVRSKEPHEIGVTYYQSTANSQNNFKVNELNGYLNMQDGVNIKTQTKEQPLFIINGEARPGINLDKEIDPKKIKSMEVLKGEKANELAASHGEKGLNGVIVIYTKD
ncbi:TonB family protein [Fontibacter flavus]|uniref:TonB family protein n=1 Tax=Fontibacter flavus TaxID=654838 RepID=A0ABV6FQR4_9BACT